MSKITLKSQYKAVTQQPNAWENDARVLVHWLVELLQLLLLFLQIRMHHCLSQLEAKMARTKGNAVR